MITTLAALAAAGYAGVLFFLGADGIRRGYGYDITIHWRMTAEQFLGRKKEESA